MLRALVVLALLTSASSGCNRKTAAEPPQKKCQSNADCPDGWACLAGACADARHGAAFMNSGQAVTPDKVRREVELQQAKHSRQVDKAVGSPESFGN